MKYTAKLFNFNLVMLLVVLPFALLLQITACSNEPDEEEIETPDYVFASEITDLLLQHEGIHFAGSAVIIGETLYFSAVIQEDFREEFSTNMLFAVNLDGSNLTDQT